MMDQQWMAEQLEQLKHQSQFRKITTTQAANGAAGHLMRDGHSLLNMSANDYLGLSQHPDIAAAMIESLQADGVGAGASRLITGSSAPYARLEAALAGWHGCEAALVFGNGYMCNLGTIAALAGRGDVVLSDRLNHASIVDGIQLSRAEHVRYRHLDLEHLESLLVKHRDARRIWIVTDAIFSMDGDAAPLTELVELKQRYGAGLIVDEAHSGGIYGPRGQGLAAELGVSSAIDVHIGTFGKSFGVYGAYVAGSAALCKWLVNKARPLIYSTALPPSVVAGTLCSLHIVQRERWRAERVRAAARKFRHSLDEAGINTSGRTDCPIIPVIVGSSDSALRFSKQLEQHRILASAIRPPTVPDHTARIRFSLSASHSELELDEALRVIKRTAMETEFADE
ncbi:8-amino-7-oxononanoate synthase [Paenibacillus curdlanolyticus YK9]|uniref:8-amino-7-ketopelargonate synthase n=1 Tax=Paenibacillus curdlanolyticus YK9 TaxID=717606 RepID=E0I6S5_9BACL|nr:8-amino-7-oxononanoate synthase [Paenibacillus curdlanolyticus]EFM11741.1 8-amino-7-oxononanoate synthase [Paenibacillus curdlanolyticus YK9]